MTESDRTSQAPKGRLPTLRPARDLTLGQLGAAAAPVKRDGPGGRKLYVPNVYYKKQRAEVQSATNTVSSKDNASVSGSISRKSRDVTDRSGGGGGGRSRQQYVQSYSMFAEGLGGGEERSRSSVGAGLGKLPGGGTSALIKAEHTDDQVEPPSQPKRPTVVVLEAKEKQHKFISDIKEGSLRPVGVPFDGEVSVKKDEQHLQFPAGSAAELFSSSDADRGDLILLQLPDLLPEDERVSDPSEVNSDGDSVPNTQQQNSTSPLDKSSLVGRIGTLQLLEDGSTRLLINGCQLHVDCGSKISHLMDVMRFEELYERQGELQTVGHVTRSAVCVPDINWLLEQRASSAGQEYHSESDDMSGS